MQQKILPLMRSARATLAGLAILSALAPVSASAAEPDSSRAGGNRQLQFLVTEALEKNPSLQAANLQAASARQGARYQRALNPPQIGVEFREIPLRSFPNPTRNQAEMEYFLEQTLPLPGKRGAMAKVERFKAEAEGSRAQSLARDIIRDVKNEYYELHGYDALLQVNAESRILMGRFVEIARKRYEVGQGSLSDILRAQAELASLDNEAISLKQARQSAAGRLNALLDRPVDGPFDSLQMDVPEKAHWTLAQLLPLAETHRQELRILEGEAKMYGAELGAARREFLPDITARGTYTDVRSQAYAPHGAAEDSWAIMVGVDLPVAPWSGPRYAASYRRARLNLDKAGRERKAASNKVASEVNEALLNARAARNQLELDRGALLPQAERALEATLAAYRTGRADFMALLDASRMALLARHNQHLALVKLMKSRAELEWAVGLSLEDITRELSQGGKP